MVCNFYQLGSKKYVEPLVLRGFAFQLIPSESTGCYPVGITKISHHFGISGWFLRNQHSVGASLQHGYPNLMVLCYYFLTKKYFQIDAYRIIHFPKQEQYTYFLYFFLI